MQLQGTFYGNNGWAGSCAGQVGGAYGAPGVWPPAGSYINSMQPGSAVPINVALNRPQYSTSMCGKLLYVRATAASAACKTCGMTPISTEYILARVTNECPECAPGSLDLGISGDGRSATHPRASDLNAELGLLNGPANTSCLNSSSIEGTQYLLQCPLTIRRDVALNACVHHTGGRSSGTGPTVAPTHSLWVPQCALKPLCSRRNHRIRRRHRPGTRSLAITLPGTTSY